MKTLITILILLLYSIDSISQGITPPKSKEFTGFISIGYDPAILHNIKDKDGNERVGAKNLDFTAKVGFEHTYARFNIAVEYFNIINYFASSAQASIILPLYFNGLYGIAGTELNLINRWGIHDTRDVINKRDNNSSSLGIGFNASLKYEFNSKFFIETNYNKKNRTDLNYHYPSNDGSNKTVDSFTFLIGYNF